MLNLKSFSPSFTNSVQGASFSNVIGANLSGGSNNVVQHGIPYIGSVDYEIGNARLAESKVGQITIPTSFAANNHVVHPSVIYEPNGWGGHTYWMCATPYPDADPAYENPEIYVSKDGITWNVPVGLVNPLIQPPGGTDYNSDPFLFLSPDKMLLCVLYRSTSQSVTRDHLNLMVSTNGIDWSVPQNLISTVSSVERLASPSIVWDPIDGMWTLYCVDVVSSPFKIVKASSSNLLGPWPARTVVTYDLPSGETEIWHKEIRRLSSGILVGIAQAGTASGGKIYPIKSTDNGQTFSFGQSIITRGGTPNNTYKSSFIPFPDSWLLYIGFLLNPSYGIEVATLTFDRAADNIANNSYLAAGTTGSISTLGGYVSWDSFNRADSAVSLGTITAGIGWTADGGTLGISSNQAYAPGAGNNKAYIASGISNIDLRAQFAVFASSGINLTFRGVDTNNFWRARLISGSVVMERIVGGAVTASYSRIWTNTAGDTLRIYAVGNMIRVYAAGTLIFEIFSNTHVSGTRHGIQIANTTDRLDSFLLSSA